MKRPSLSVCVVASLALLACGSKETGADASDAGTTGDSAGTESGTESGTTAATTSTEFVPIPARDITVTRLEINQGVAINIAENGEWVKGAGRNAQIVQGREALARAFFEVGPEFVPRTLQGRFTVELPDGEVQAATKTFEVSQSSTDADVDSTFWWILPAEFMGPSTRVNFEILETELGYEDTPEPDPAPRAIVEPGLHPIGVEDSNQAIKAVLVPVRHEIDGVNNCPDAPDITDEVVAFFKDDIHMQNPTDRVEITVRDEVVYNGSQGSFGPVLSMLAQLRASDNAPVDVYYYGLTRPCDGGPDGVGGQAIDIPDWPTMGNAYSRTAVGRWYPGGLTFTSSTFVHEIGHTQGLRHVLCNGEEGGVNPSYPYEMGSIGVWGYGIKDKSLHGPADGSDYMTYCDTTWVSDWTWRKTYPVIEEITSWEMGAPTPEPPGPDDMLLIGLFDEAGVETFFTVPGRLDAATGQDVALMVDGKIVSLPTRRGEMGDGGGTNLVAQLPAALDFSAVEAITVAQDGMSRDLPPSAVRLHPLKAATQGH